MGDRSRTISGKRVWYSGELNDFVDSMKTVAVGHLDNSGGIGRSRTVGLRYYELSDHLGNVVATVLDRKTGVLASGSVTLYDRWVADVASLTDYYPFGMQMPGRVYEAGIGLGGRFGFNGMQKDEELKGKGNSLDFGARMYDSRLGRWNSQDPFAAKYPNISTYAFCLNNPVIFIDPDGKRVIVGSRTTATTGAANPSCIGLSMARTDVRFKFVAGSAPNLFDITLSGATTFSISYANPGPNGKTLEQENPGWTHQSEVHEDVHWQRSIQAVNQSYTWTSTSRVAKSYSGTVDVILSQYMTDVNENIESEFNLNVNNYEASLPSTMGEDAKAEAVLTYRREKRAAGESARSLALNSAVADLYRMLTERDGTLNEDDGRTGVIAETSKKLSEEGVTEHTRLRWQGTTLTNCR